MGMEIDKNTAREIGCTERERGRRLGMRVEGESVWLEGEEREWLEVKSREERRKAREGWDD